MKRILVLFVMLFASVMCSCGQIAGQPSAVAPEETPFVRPSPRILNLEGEYELRGMSRDGVDESEAISQLRLLGMNSSLSVSEANAGSLLFMNQNSQVDFHVLDGTVTVNDPNGGTYEIEYQAHDDMIEFEWQGDLLRFEKGEKTTEE